MKRQFLKLALLSAGMAMAGLSGTAFAQDKPTLKILVGFPPGGSVDVVARLLAERMRASLDQNVIVENKPGASNTIAADLTAKAAPDGHTLLVATNTGQAIAPHLIKLAFDPIKDLTPIGLVVTVPNVLVVNPNVPAKSVQELVALAKSKPGQLSYGSGGNGSAANLATEYFKMQTETAILHIPYRGIAPATTDLIAGQTQAMFPGLAAALPHIRNGRLRALAVTGSQRHPALKDVPTMEEAGLKGFDAQQWYGVVGPAGMPAPLVTQLNNAMAQVLAMPDLRDKLSAEAVELTPMTPAQFGEYMKQDLARWSTLARERNINLDN